MFLLVLLDKLILLRKKNQDPLFLIHSFYTGVEGGNSSVDVFSFLK